MDKNISNLIATKEIKKIEAEFLKLLRAKYMAGDSETFYFLQSALRQVAIATHLEAAEIMKKKYQDVCDCCGLNHVWA